MSVADIAAATIDAGRSVRAAVKCAHCALDVPAGLLESNAERQFCCAGCRSAWSILHEHGLDLYYSFGERREERVKSTGRAYEEFDHPTFGELYVRPLTDGLAQTELYLEGVHCASCVWLVERVPLLLPGVSGAELDVRRSLARIVWDPSTVRLSAIARMLDSLGYAPHPFRGVARDAMRRKEDRAMLVRIGVSGAIAINAMLAALALYSGWLGGMDRGLTDFFRWISLALVTPTLLWPGRVFFSGALAALRARTLNMDVPIALGLAAGYVQGAVNTIRGSGPIYFDGVAALTFALLVGRYLQQRGQRAATDSAELLFSVTPTTARVVAADDSITEVPAQALLPGMLIDVRPGDAFAADGVIESGNTRINSALLTGESRAVAARMGDAVFAGTLNVASPVRVRVEQTGESSRVAKIMRQVEESARRRAPVVQLANRMAAWFVAAVLVLAALTALVWWQIDRAKAIDASIALLIVTCPCALALSTPLAVSVGIGRAARAGIFVKGGDALERLANPGHIFLDKTGTITEGRTALVRWNGSDAVKPFVLALEEGSVHPIASAFRDAWPDVAAASVEGAEHVVGGGIVGAVEGHTVVIGSPAFVSERCELQRHSACVGETDDELTPVWVAVDGAIAARAGIGDPIREDASASIAALKRAGWRVSILSGDAPSVVRAVGRAVGVADDACVGAASPETKRLAVEAAHGDAPVVMVGDGINDASAMAAASVGVGVHGGAEACLASADVYVTTPGLAALVTLTTGARRTLWVIERNVVFSLIYNALGAGLAMAGVLTPLIAAILMPASSLTVVLASWRTRTFE